jgi:hypothetical protein
MFFMKNNLLKNVAICCFLSWLLFWPVPEKTTSRNQSQQALEIISLRGGSKQTENSATPQLQLSTNQSKPSIESTTNSAEIGSESKSFYAQTGKFVSTSGSGKNPGGSSDTDLDLTINSKNWSKWICPNPDEVIPETKCRFSVTRNFGIIYKKMNMKHV